MGEKRNAYRVLVGKSEGMRPVGKPRYRWEDNIQMDLGEQDGGVGLDSPGSGYRPVDDTCEHGNEPSCSITSSEILEQMSDHSF
jgi:hypothetical protein